MKNSRTLSILFSTTCLDRWHFDLIQNGSQSFHDIMQIKTIIWALLTSFTTQNCLKTVSFVTWRKWFYILCLCFLNRSCLIIYWKSFMFIATWEKLLCEFLWKFKTLANIKQKKEISHSTWAVNKKWNVHHKFFSSRNNSIMAKAIRWIEMHFLCDAWNRINFLI